MQQLRGRRPLALVLRDVPPELAAAPVDWSAWYLTDEEDMGQSVEQSGILWEFLSSVGELAVEREWKNVLWSSDNFFAWVQSEPQVRVSPDAYLLDDPPPPPRPKSWQTWLPGHKAPRWAVECVSEDWKKDYEDSPPKYAQLGTSELVIFDPEAAPGDERAERVPLQVYRRSSDGAFVQVYRGDGPAWMEEIEAFLVVVRRDGEVRLRIARDAKGADLVPTAEERARAAAERAHAAEERARTAEERAHAAEERARRLEEQLAKLRSN